ncbi:Histone transcription regulator 3, partial [Pichia kudriavzevii]
MSSFTALNLSDEEVDIEEHTRELQIEVALQTLQRGLEYQKNGDYLNARRKYDELGRIEIIQMVNSTNNPTIDSLKYLCFRNRGMLRLRELIDNSIKTNNGNPSVHVGGDSHKEKVNDYGDDDVGISVYGEFLGAMNDLLNAVSFGTPDDKIIIILASLFEHFGYLRLSRLCYELKTFNDDILLINDAKLIDGYLKLLSNLNVHNRVYSKLKDKIERSLFWKNRNEFKSYDWDKLLTLEAWENERCDALKEELVIEVDVNDGIVNIDHLLGEFVGCLPKPKGRGKCYDGYTLTGKTIDKVEFEFHFKNTEPIRSEDTNDSVEKPHSERKMEDLDLPEKNDAVLTASDSGNQVINDTVRFRVLRTKNEDDQNDQLKNSLERLNNFASVTLPSFLKTCNININFPSLVNLILYGDECGIDLMTRKFYSCIKSWDDDFTQCLSVTGDNKKKNNESVREILNINSSKVINHSKYTTADVVSLKPFLDSMNSGGMHFNEIRMHVLEYLFNSKYICFNNMSKASLRNLKSIVDSVSINYFNQMEKSVNIGETIDSRMLNIAVSIFELLVDSFLEQSKEQKLKITKSSNLLQDPYSSENILINRINKWSSIIEDMLITDQTIGKSEVWCRFKWFQLLYLQSCPSHIKTQILTDLLTDLIDVIRSNELYLPYVNFELVPVLSYESISTQHSKLSILQMFDSNDKSNEILENILLGLPNPTLNDDPAK